MVVFFLLYHYANTFFPILLLFLVLSWFFCSYLSYMLLFLAKFVLSFSSVLVVLSCLSHTLLLLIILILYCLSCLLPFHLCFTYSFLILSLSSGFLLLFNQFSIFLYVLVILYPSYASFNYMHVIGYQHICTYFNFVLTFVGLLSVLSMFVSCIVTFSQFCPRFW